MDDQVVFTNGCFDIVHRGHLELLKFCRTLGTKVIVGLNSDSSVQANKGKNRPINNDADRKFFLESLVYVDEVIIFEKKTPYDLIKQLKPDIIVKGGEYLKEEVVGADLALVIIFDHIDGYSTTKAIQSTFNRR